MFKTIKDTWRLLTLKQFYYTQWGLLRTIGIKRILSIGWKVVRTGTIFKLITGKKEKVFPVILSSLWDSFGDREAVISDGKRYSFTEFKDRVFRLGNGLKDLGLTYPDKVAVMLFNSNNYLEVMYGSSFLGCANPAINWHLSGDDLAAAVNRSKPKAMIFDKTFINTIIEAKDKMPDVKNFIVVGETDELPKGFIAYEEMLAKSSNKMPDGKFLFALNPYTGGTTGIPKSINYYDAFSTIFGTSIEKPRVSFLEFLRLLNKQFSMFYYFNAHKISDLRSLVIAPVYHAGALVGVLPFFFGGTLVMMKKFNAEEALSLIEKEKISWIFTVPTILQRILALDDSIKQKYDLGSIDTLISAAAPCPVEVKKGINDLFLKNNGKKNIFYEYYGSAETGIITLLQPDDYKNNPERLMSVGKIRCGEMKILNAEGKPAGINERGRIHNRTMMTVILNYPGSREKLDDVLLNIDGEEYYDDGLIGYLDKDNFLYLTGREKELIIMGGVNIYPVELEEKILKHPLVIDVAVIGIPDKDLGEKVHAEIQLKEDEHLSEEEILKHCEKEKLTGFKLPRSIKFVDELPRHIDGKLIKRELRDKYWEGVKQIG